MFNPNAGVPKTLVKHLVTWYAKKCATPDVRVILEDILATPVSPELTGEGDLSQNTDDIVGPGRLRDFFMNEFERRGSRPEKMGYLALQAFGEEYDHETVGKWLEIYLNRHTASQWKRNASPDGTKIGTIDQSPRGSKRMAPNTSANWHK
jgi:NAD+ synthase (glutamine-hydrolysing)